MSDKFHVTVSDEAIDRAAAELGPYVPYITLRREAAEAALRAAASSRLGLDRIVTLSNIIDALKVAENDLNEKPRDWLLIATWLEDKFTSSTSGVSWPD